MKDLIIRKNAVRESIVSGQASCLYVTGLNSRDPIASLAREKGIPVKVLPDKEMDKKAGTASHQGFCAEVEGFPIISLSEMIARAKTKQYPLILMLDGIEDPHNMGAILRSADAFSIDGIIVKNRGNAPLNATVARISTGAIHYVNVAAVSNLSQAISELKDAGYWIVASDGSATQSYADVDYKCPICAIVGSEGFGISKLVLQRSDFIVKIPMTGHVNSLNASVATGILLSHIALSRN